VLIWTGFLGWVRIVSMAEKPMLERSDHVLDDGALLPRLLGGGVAAAATGKAYFLQITAQEDGFDILVLHFDSSGNF
jgi:hypothetical protein